MQRAERVAFAGAGESGWIVWLECGHSVEAQDSREAARMVEFGMKVRCYTCPNGGSA